MLIGSATTGPSNLATIPHDIPPSPQYIRKSQKNDGVSSSLTETHHLEGSASSSVTMLPHMRSPLAKVITRTRPKSQNTKVAITHRGEVVLTSPLSPQRVPSRKPPPSPHESISKQTPVIDPLCQHVQQVLTPVLQSIVDMHNIARAPVRARPRRSRACTTAPQCESPSYHTNSTTTLSTSLPTTPILKYGLGMAANLSASDSAECMCAGLSGARLCGAGEGPWRQQLQYTGEVLARARGQVDHMVTIGGRASVKVYGSAHVVCVCECAVCDSARSVHTSPSSWVNSTLAPPAPASAAQLLCAAPLRKVLESPLRRILTAVTGKAGTDCTSTYKTAVATSSSVLGSVVTDDTSISSGKPAERYMALACATARKIVTTTDVDTSTVRYPHSATASPCRAHVPTNSLSDALLTSLRHSILPRLPPPVLSLAVREVANVCVDYQLYTIASPPPMSIPPAESAQASSLRVSTTAPAPTLSAPRRPAASTAPVAQDTPAAQRVNHMGVRERLLQAATQCSPRSTTSNSTTATSETRLAPTVLPPITTLATESVCTPPLQLQPQPLLIPLGATSEATGAAALVSSLALSLPLVHALVELEHLWPATSRAPLTASHPRSTTLRSARPAPCTLPPASQGTPATSQSALAAGPSSPLQALVEMLLRVQHRANTHHGGALAADTIATAAEVVETSHRGLSSTHTAATGPYSYGADTQLHGIRSQGLLAELQRLQTEVRLGVSTTTAATGATNTATITSSGDLRSCHSPFVPPSSEALLLPLAQRIVAYVITYNGYCEARCAYVARHARSVGQWRAQAVVESIAANDFAANTKGRRVGSSVAPESWAPPPMPALPTLSPHYLLLEWLLSHCTPDGLTCLHRACAAGDVATVRLLLGCAAWASAGRTAAAAVESVMVQLGIYQHLATATHQCTQAEAASGAAMRVWTTTRSHYSTSEARYNSSCPCGVSHTCSSAHAASTLSPSSVRHSCACPHCPSLLPAQLPVLSIDVVFRMLMKAMQTMSRCADWTWLWARDADGRTPVAYVDVGGVHAHEILRLLVSAGAHIDELVELSAEAPTADPSPSPSARAPGMWLREAPAAAARELEAYCSAFEAFSADHIATFQRLHARDPVNDVSIPKCTLLPKKIGAQGDPLTLHSVDTHTESRVPASRWRWLPLGAGPSPQHATSPTDALSPSAQHVASQLHIMTPLAANTHTCITFESSWVACTGTTSLSSSPAASQMPASPSARRQSTSTPFGITASHPDPLLRAFPSREALIRCAGTPTDTRMALKLHSPLLPARTLALPTLSAVHKLPLMPGVLTSTSLRAMAIDSAPAPIESTDSIGASVAQCNLFTSLSLKQLVVTMHALPTLSARTPLRASSAPHYPRNIELSLGSSAPLNAQVCLFTPMLAALLALPTPRPLMLATLLQGGADPHRLATAPPLPPLPLPPLLGSQTAPLLPTRRSIGIQLSAFTRPLHVALHALAVELAALPPCVFQALCGATTYSPVHVHASPLGKGDMEGELAASSSSPPFASSPLLALLFAPLHMSPTHVPVFALRDSIPTTQTSSAPSMSPTLRTFSTAMSPVSSESTRKLSFPIIAPEAPPVPAVLTRVNDMMVSLGLRMPVAALASQAHAVELEAEHENKAIFLRIRARAACVAILIHTGPALDLPDSDDRCVVTYATELDRVLLRYRDSSIESTSTVDLGPKLHPPPPQSGLDASRVKAQAPLLKPSSPGPLATLLRHCVDTHAAAQRLLAAEVTAALSPCIPMAALALVLDYLG